MQTKLDHHLGYFIVMALVAVCYLMFFYQLGGIGFLGPDEPRFASVARGMYETGDYITPRLNGEEWFEKPPLMYWLAALSFSVFGVGEMGARFPSAVSATFSVFLIYWCGFRLFSRNTGFSAAVILASSVGFFSLARAASMDMLLTSALTAALVFFLFGMDANGRSRRWYFYSFYISLGFGVLAKGPIAVILAAFALILFLIWNGEYGAWKRWHLEGILLTFIVALPWYVAVIWVNGQNFINDFIINQNIQRFISEIHGHQQPFYFFVPVLLLMIFPWSFLLLPAFSRSFSRSGKLIVAWALAPFVFFSFSGSKLPAYILPMVGSIALLCALEINLKKTRSFQLAVLCQAALSVGFGMTIAFFRDAINIDLDAYAVVLAGGFFIAALALIGIALWMSPPVLGLFNAGMMMVIVLVITSVIFPHGVDAETMEPWKEKLDRFVSKQEKVVLYKPDRWMEYGLQYYRENNIVTALSEGELVKISEGDQRVFCIAEANMLEELSSSDDVAIEVVDSIGNQVAFWAWLP